MRFGDFSLDLVTGELRSNGQTSFLQEKPFQILLLLLEKPGQLVTRDELIKRLWSSDTFVDFDQSLNKAVNRLREALGESAEHPRFIETLPRRGYRLMAPVGDDTIFEATSEAAASGRSKVEAAPRWLKWLALSIVVLAAALSQRWFAGHRTQSNPLEDLKQRRLTANSSENAVTSGSISPDGRQLAYSDVKGIHIKQIDSGQVRDIALPASLKGPAQNWVIVNNWIRDGSAIIANAAPPAHQPSVWLVPVNGEPMRKIRDEARAWTLSRDGLWLAFGANLNKLYYRELWIARSNGEDAHKVFDADDNAAFGGAEWSPDGRRLAYVKLMQTAENGEMTIESRALEGGPGTKAITSAYPREVEDWAWSPDGRIIYSLADAVEKTCNFFQVRLDTRTGKPMEQPKRFTNWSGFCMDHPSFSADGKRIAFLRSSLQTGVYLSDLHPGETKISAPVLLTLSEGRNDPIGWTQDGKAVVFVSNRDGHPQLFHQGVASGTAEPILPSLPDLTVGPQMSPDGAWILYLVYPSGWGSSEPVALMKIGLAGGAPHLVMRTSVGSKPSQRCARLPAKLCAIAERSSDQKHIIFTQFDPLQGRESELLRFDTETTPDADYAWDLSPDGTRIAILKRSDATISLLSLVGRAQQNIVVKSWSRLQTLDWSADGNELFASCLTNEGSTLLRLDLKGNAYALWETKGSSQPPGDLFYNGTLAPRAVPSPDGRHLAIQSGSLSANIWMIENF